MSKTTDPEIHSSGSTIPTSTNMVGGRKKGYISAKVPLRLNELPRYHPANFERSQHIRRSPKGSTNCSPNASPRFPPSPSPNLRNGWRAELQQRPFSKTSQPFLSSYFEIAKTARAVISPYSLNSDRTFHEPASPDLNPIKAEFEGPMTPLLLEEGGSSEIKYGTGQSLKHPEKGG